MEDVEASEAKMSSTKGALLRYIEKRGAIDRESTSATGCSTQEGVSGIPAGNFQVG